MVTAQDHDECPAWSPDGKRMAIPRGRAGREDFLIIKPDMKKIKAASDAQPVKDLLIGIEQYRLV